MGFALHRIVLLILLILSKKSHPEMVYVKKHANSGYVRDE